MRLWSPLIAAAAIVAPVSAGAHRGHDAISVVTVAKDGAIRVSHRFEAHDIEPALVRIAPDAQPSLDDPAAIAALQRYLALRFELAADGAPVPLTLDKTDTTGTAEVRVEFVGRVAVAPKAMSVRSSILSDVYPRQQHQVNVRMGDVVRTVRLNGGATRTVQLT